MQQGGLEETRVDPADGNWYTLAEFIDAYEGANAHGLNPPTPSHPRTHPS